VDPNIKLYIKGQLVKEDGTTLGEKDYVAVTNHFSHSFSEQCVVILKGVTVTRSSDLYAYRAYLETLLTYGSDAAATHLTNPYWYLDKGNMIGCDPITSYDKNTNHAFIARWKILNSAKR
jgi:hypothetical protein